VTAEQPWWPVLLALAAALLAWPRPGAGVRGRLRRLTAVGLAGQPAPAHGVTRPAPDAPHARWVLAAAAGVGSGLLVGGVPGLVVGVVVAVVAERALRRAGADDRMRRAAVVQELPAACELLAVCLSAGVPVVAAVGRVGEAVPEPVGAHLREVAALYRLGAEPRRAWSGVPPELGPLGRMVVRAGESGAAAVPALRALAADARAQGRARTEAAVRRAGVWILAPLGLCFLPAFVCLGVAPLVLGIAGDVFV
jgi:pilus assembly protein TadC